MLSLEFSDKIALKYYKAIKASIKDFDLIGLTEQNVKNLILSRPEHLKEMNNDFIVKIIPNFNFDEFIAYLKKNKADRAKDLKYYTKISQIKNVFRYSQIVGNKYFLAELLDQHTCIYCNRNYVKTIGNTKNKIIRAEYDHFFSQSKYPLLALSFYNLIPICSNCNKKKLDDDFDISTHLHPYLMNIEEKKFSFSFRKKTFSENNIKVNITTNNIDAQNKIKNTFRDLCLSEIYNAHSNKELRDLLDLRYKYSENYLDILLNKTFKGLAISKEEVYRMIFGIEINENDYHGRPFSKFKHDIIEELKKNN